MVYACLNTFYLRSKVVANNKLHNVLYKCFISLYYIIYTIYYYYYYFIYIYYILYHLTIENGKKKVCLWSDLVLKPETPKWCLAKRRIKVFFVFIKRRLELANIFMYVCPSVDERKTWHIHHMLNAVNKADQADKDRWHKKHIAGTHRSI